MSERDDNRKTINMFKETLENQNLLELLPDIIIHFENGNSGILLADDCSLIINPVNPSTIEVLEKYNVKQVDQVLFTHHRRELADGLSLLMDSFSPEIGVPKGEKELFENAEEYWLDERSRWRRLMVPHYPCHITHTATIPVAHVYTDGDCFQWRSFQIEVIATPGYTDGSVSYIVRQLDKIVVFCGDIIYAPGMIRDLYSLQHEDRRHGVSVGDYHGFMGSRDTLKTSLDKLADIHPDFSVPVHGEIIEDTVNAVELLKKRLDEYYLLYSEVTALRWYRHDYFNDYSDSDRVLPGQKTYPFPPEIKKVFGNTWILKSENDRAIIIDPHCEESTVELKKVLASGEVKGYDWIWVTHFHSDHTNGADLARETFHCPVTTDAILADVISSQESYLLPCQQNIPVKVKYPRKHGESWQWENFTFTSYHFPGQSYYHSGLGAVSDDGKRYLFVGDSLTPNGIDDYCTGNRNFLGDSPGYKQCIKIVREFKPDLIFNPHLIEGFHFSESALDKIDGNLDMREQFLAELLPWPHPNFGLDESWVTIYPYEQHVGAGQTVLCEVRCFNHDSESRLLTVEPVLPDNWCMSPNDLEFQVEALSESSLNFNLRVPGNAASGKYVVPVNVKFGDIKMGSFKEFIVKVSDKSPDIRIASTSEDVLNGI